jgi:RimJ/RimL family protein N-acetyltransferase
LKDKLNIAVREIQIKDIDLIADYWLKSDSAFLIQMGVDLNKLPTRIDLRVMLTEQINASLLDKNSYALIWELNDKQIGHTNVNNIEYGKIATMHLHLWNSTTRKKGLGTELIRMSLPFYFKRLKIKKLICEPYGLNPAPNKTLKKIGFKLIKKYTTTPGALNFEQVVNRWELTQEHFISKYDKTMDHSL